MSLFQSDPILLTLIVLAFVLELGVYVFKFAPYYVLTAWFPLNAPDPERGDWVEPNPALAKERAERRHATGSTSYRPELRMTLVRRALWNDTKRARGHLVMVLRWGKGGMDGGDGTVRAARWGVPFWFPLVSVILLYFWKPSLSTYEMMAGDTGIILGAVLALGALLVITVLTKWSVDEVWWALFSEDDEDDDAW